MQRIISIIVLSLLLASCSKDNNGENSNTSKIQVSADGFYLAKEFKPNQSDFKLRLGEMNDFDVKKGEEFFLYYASFSTFGGSINFGDSYEENGDSEKYTLTLDGKTYNYVFGDVLRLKNKGSKEWTVDIFIKRGDSKK